MTRSKLSGPEKQEIAALFEHQQESIASLAERYQVSSSTIRRLLKNLPAAAKAKASALEQSLSDASSPEISSPGAAFFETPSPESGLLESPALESPASGAALASSRPKPVPKVSKKNEAIANSTLASSAPQALGLEGSQVESAQVESAQVESARVESAQAELAQDFSEAIAQNPQPEEPSAAQPPVRRRPVPKKVLDKAAELTGKATPEPTSLTQQQGEALSAEGLKPLAAELPAVEEELSEIVQEIGQDPKKKFVADVLNGDDGDDGDGDDDEGDNDDDDDDFEDLDDDLEDGFDDAEGFEAGSGLQLNAEGLMAVVPFAEAILPKTCYLVIDRTAELVTRPLKDFGELGQIPGDEVQSRTLPVFDNHRIARRFSHRNQRIIKIPNADILKKTCTQLAAKGITRLLVNGQIYSL
ncbi:MAG: hypothetical protein MH252_04965 [Thermosynechococcaceae cyanobacterium MS004]|nr:hypothetical protein [Thermosynechococcaceae cyanobacterium MS004]